LRALDWPKAPRAAGLFHGPRANHRPGPAVFGVCGPSPRRKPPKNWAFSLAPRFRPIACLDHLIGGLCRQRLALGSAAALAAPRRSRRGRAGAARRLPSAPCGQWSRTGGALPNLCYWVSDLPGGRQCALAAADVPDPGADRWGARWQSPSATLSACSTGTPERISRSVWSRSTDAGAWSSGGDCSSHSSVSHGQWRTAYASRFQSGTCRSRRRPSSRRRPRLEHVSVKPLALVCRVARYDLRARARDRGRSYGVAS
jgi:hypothetical protein